MVKDITPEVAPQRVFVRTMQTNVEAQLLFDQLLLRDARGK